MDIQILQLIDGARSARGLTVIIDVFRAFSLEAYMMSKGAKRIIPIGDADLAYKLKKENPDFILAGERHGKILPGFDIGNSPSQLHSIDLNKKTVIHTTSAGTQGIANAINAEEILGGSLVNAHATAQYIKKSGFENVSLVCMGLEALEPSDEDTLCAMYIKSLVEEIPFDLESEIKKLKYTTGAKFFDPLQQNVFPQDDFLLCTDVDKFNFVLKLNQADVGIPYMERHQL